jgi:CheY-like chemotaxis protein
LAEDNLPDALLVREAIKLENLPVEVYLASDGEQAIGFLTRAEQDPDAPFPHVLLLDLNLPKADGFEVLRRIRSSDKYKHIPVLIVSSSESPADLSEGARLGAGYFHKPSNYEEYLKIGGVLKRLLEANGLL